MGHFLASWESEFATAVSAFVNFDQINRTE